MSALELVLIPEQESELRQVLQHSPKPYLRERAACLLKIGQGQSGRQVAQSGLLCKRRKHTVYRCYHAYKSGGLAGLSIQAVRGRKPAFSP
jgi:transposase